MIERALRDLREGRFVLIYDSDQREKETDLVLLAKHATPKRIAQMRLDGGGLICLALGRDVWTKLGLPFMKDLLAKTELATLAKGSLPYDERSAFSIAINHCATFTGISDEDRALTARKLYELIEETQNSSEQEARLRFVQEFRSPGHVPLLLSRGLEERRGHTELATELARAAGVFPVVLVCEMLDGNSGKSLTKEKALSYARARGLCFIEGEELESYLG